MLTEWNIESLVDSSVFAGAIWLILIAVFIGSYILRGIGLHTVATRRQVDTAWFAWMPLLHHFLLGKLSDQYNYFAKGKRTGIRWWLLALGIISGLCTAFFVILLLLMIGQAMLILLTVGLISLSEEFSASGEQIKDILAWYPLARVLTGLPLIIVRLVALHKLYASSRPDKKSIWLVLSIIFRFTEPIFIFIGRKSDMGMRPAPAAYAPTQPQYQPPQYQPPQYQPPQYQPPQYQPPQYQQPQHPQMQQNEYGQNDQNIWQ